MREPIDVFISYAAEDDAFARELERHLSALQHDGLIRPWDTRRIGAGADWRAAVDVNIERARLILLLVSADYLSSDYCHDRELTRAIERHRLGQALVIPIVVRSVDWRDSKFDLISLNVLPRGGKPITHPDWGGRDRAWTHVATALRSVVEDLRGTSRSMPSVHGASYVRANGGVSAATPIPGTRPPHQSHGTSATTQGRPGRGWLLWALAAGVTLVVLLLMAVIASNLSASRSQEEPRTPAWSPPPSPKPQPQPVSHAAPCCGGIECSLAALDPGTSICRTPGHCAVCKSGRSFVAGRCMDHLPRAQTWLLRLAHVDVQGASQSAQVCVQRSADASQKECTLSANAADSPSTLAERTRLAITTADLLTGGGLEVAVWDGGRAVTWASRATINDTDLLRSALCVGVTLHLPGGTVRFYLDDP